MSSTPETAEPIADERLLAAHGLARAALAEITPESTIGDPAGYTVEDDGVVSLRFANRLEGYPGWFWTVSLARVADAEPTVLEAELLPGDGALLAPEWVPWDVRLADYQAAQVAGAESDDADAAADADDALDDDDALDEDDELDDVEDLDAADFDEDASPILHAGDLDGVDIDEVDESADDEDGFDDEDQSDDDEDRSADEDGFDDEDRSL